MPALIAHHQEKVTVTKLKKAYSILSQAYQRAVDDNGAPEGWGVGDMNDPQGAENIYKKLSPYLSIVKDCGTGPGCFYSGIYKKVNKKNNWTNIDNDTSNLGLYKFILADGMSIYIQSRDAECKEGSGIGLTPAARSICAFIGVDINGTNKPNTLGSDLFIFLLTSHGLFPRGNSAIPSGVSSFEEQCLDKTSNGWACAAWVIYNENLDYLHCDDLSWNGKTKCK